MDILHCVDHTLLKADASWEDIKKIVKESKEYACASACIPPCFVKRAKEETGAYICTVIGFPLGYQTTYSKVEEARQAVEDGADEVDMVMNISAFKNKDYGYVQDEISKVKSAIGSSKLKVIVETCYLDTEEKIAACKLVELAGADYIKTSTGFSDKGADIEDIKLFKKICPELKVKAAGGISTLEQARAFRAAGADRIGASKLVEAKRIEDNK